MKYFNKYRQEKELNVSAGVKVEIMIRSALYCNEDEEPIYHHGTVREIVYEEFDEFPIVMYVVFNQEHLFEDQEDELIYLADIEDVFIKKYDIVGYGILNEGVTLSVKGEGISKIIWFDYIGGSLIPVSINKGESDYEQPVKEEDKVFIQDVQRYGAAQSFSHYVLSKSK